MVPGTSRRTRAFLREVSHGEAKLLGQGGYLRIYWRLRMMELRRYESASSRSSRPELKRFVEQFEEAGAHNAGPCVQLSGHGHSMVRLWSESLKISVDSLEFYFRMDEDVRPRIESVLEPAEEIEIEFVVGLDRRCLRSC